MSVLSDMSPGADPSRPLGRRPRAHAVDAAAVATLPISGYRTHISDC